MEKVFAQHATAGKYHLETWPMDGRWEWKAIAMKPGLPEFTGTADSLEGAKERAMHSIGRMTELMWTVVGPERQDSD
jgi:hypothetical protein